MKTLNKLAHTTIKTKLRMLIMAILLPLGILAAVLLFMVNWFSGQYQLIVRNVTVASQFNVDFKKNLDYNMYRYVIGSKGFEEFDAYADLEDARSVVNRLEETTVRPDSLKRLDAISKYLTKLGVAIQKTREGRGYDYNISKLYYDIFILTELITDEMHNYIYYETHELANLQQSTDSIVRRTVLIAGAVTLALISALLFAALRIANGITKPIIELSENIKMVGEGDFTVRSVNSLDDEIKTLSIAFDTMVGRIGELVEDVKRKQQDLRKTELQLLQSQINPHFLYNTFDTIIWLAEDNQMKQVVDITTSLSMFFRTSLSRGQDFITIKEEEAHVRSYLEIQSVRYRDILSYEVHIPEEVYEVRVPKLTLQPLVENALYHGIKYKRGSGHISVSARKDEGRLIFEVSDDGIGMTSEQLEKLNGVLQNMKDNGGGSVGCLNVNKRIKLYFGENYGLSFESEYGSGTKAIVIISA